MKKLSMTLSLLALHAHAADDKGYLNHPVTMTCGGASYTLTSTCKSSGDPMELNDCKPQTLVIDQGGAKRSTTLPELPAKYAAQIRASGRDLQDLFVISWACSKTADGPIATLYYSIGGGSAEYSEAWTHYDKAGKLVVDDSDITPKEVGTIEKNMKRVPSIMPE